MKAVYFITGGNRGIGLGLVKALLSRPDTIVVASARNEAAIDEAKGEISDFGRGSSLHFLVLDFTSAVAPEKVREAFLAATENSVDHVDVLINNAALATQAMSVVETMAEDLRSSFEVNTIAPMLVFQGLWPLLAMAKGAAPKVIMVSSSLGSIGAQEPLPSGAYGPSKASLNWITRALHIQHEARGLVAVALHPGWVKTRMGDKSAREWKIDAGPRDEVEDSVSGMLNVIDEATREKYSGQFVTFQGKILPW